MNQDADYCPEGKEHKCTETGFPLYRYVCQRCGRTVVRITFNKGKPCRSCHGHNWSHGTAVFTKKKLTEPPK